MPDPQTDQTVKKHGEDYKPEDYSVIFGPDKKVYKFPKGTSQKQADRYFQKKGIKESSGLGTKEEDSLLTAITSGKISKEAKKKLGSAAVDYISTALPTLGGVGFSMAAGSKSNPAGIGMAALGGGAGEALNQLTQRIAFGRDSEGNPIGGKTDTSWNAAKNIAVEAAKQGGYEGAGRAGAMFFKWLPHAKVDNGILLFPSDIKGGKITRYVEDFLSNVIGSADIWTAAREKQVKSIEKAGLDLAEGISKFKGDSKTVGTLIEETLNKARDQTLDGLIKNANKKGLTKAAFEASAPYKEWERIFDDAFVKQIGTARNPETIAGLLRKGGSKDIEMIKEALKEHPETLEIARARIFKDMLSEELTGAADPMVRKVLQNKGLPNGMQSYTDKSFAGPGWIKEFNEMGEARAKDVFGETHYKAIKDLTDTIKRVSGGKGSSFIGRFYNLTYILGPLRGTFGVGQAGQIAALRTLAKIMTSPEGVEAINGYIRASAAQSPKLIGLARDEYKKQVDRAFHEQKIEEQIIKNHYENKGKDI